MTNSTRKYTDDFKDEIINAEYSELKMKKSLKPKQKKKKKLKALKGKRDSNINGLVRISNPEVNKSIKWWIAILIKMIYLGKL